MTYKYYAFISYKRGGADEKYASWLQRRLERYRIPAITGIQNLPKRLKVFRDKTDLGSHASLGEGLSRNLENSRFLIVVCSPRSAESPYVADEVRWFLENARGENILPFIIEGTPEPRNEREQQCYPSVLPHSILGVTLSDGTREEAFIKILARLLQVDYPDLYRRHLRATRRLVMQALAGTLAVLALMAVLALWAVSAERRATEQRLEAESLIRFLTFDMADEAFDYIPIRARLAISERIQGYYDRWGVRNREIDYSRAKYLMDRATTARMAGNEAKNRRIRMEALDVLERLHSAEPDNELYFELYDQVLRQVGALWVDDDPEKTKSHYRKSLEAARGFVGRNPGAGAARAQLADALSTLGARYVVEGELQAALPFLTESAKTWEELFLRFPQMNGEPYYIEKIAELSASFSHFFRLQGNMEAAAAWSEKALASYENLRGMDPDNLNTLFLYGGELDNATMLETGLGRLASADIHSREAIEVKRTLLARDTENVDSRFHLATSLAYGGVLRTDMGDDAGAKALLEEALEILTPLDYPRKGAYNAMLELVKTQLDTLKSKSNGRRNDGADAQK
ncbi:MAG: toll/interleukin-1 receptor domain-containing protein [Synergistaceae bacterium]|nr:toll/interleukin-1 receptor domain-containing protein [Synergistaceae bacterium]